MELPVVLRRLTLAACVLDDVDLVPLDDGIVLEGRQPVTVPYAELARALRGADPESDLARVRVTSWLRGRRAAAERELDELRARARPVGLPVGHVLHPGSDWVRLRVMGDVLDLGFGFVGLGGDPDEVQTVPAGALAAGGADLTPWWPEAVDNLERMGAVAAERLRVNPLLRPIGDCDVVTLLGSTILRSALCEHDGTGMRAAAVPMRRRGWLDLSRIDPAFTLAAAAATDELDRGFLRPLLITVDEVAMAPEGGQPAEIVLRDPAAATPHLRSVLFR